MGHATTQLTLRQKSNYAVQHMIAATQFSRICGEVQQENIGKAYGPFFDVLRANVSATIMLCVAALESNINEYLSDPASLFPEVPDSARDEFVELLEPVSILDKYQRTLSFKGVEAFSEGEEPYQSVKTLITLRNELVHFHPEWHDEQVRHRKIGQKLEGKFEFSPFLAEGSAPIFPMRFISHGCTQWAVNSSIAFMNTFSSMIVLDCKFDVELG